jgi:hypothetical protein
MLTRAVEGAWTEVGLGLARAAGANDPNAQRLRTNLEHEQYTLASRIARVAEFYNTASCKPVRDASGIDKMQLSNVEVWSTTVRTSRNVLHTAVSPEIDPTHENVATLLLGALPNITTLYLIKSSADTVTPTRPVSSGST